MRKVILLCLLVCLTCTACGGTKEDEVIVQPHELVPRADILDKVEEDTSNEVIDVSEITVDDLCSTLELFTQQVQGMNSDIGTLKTLLETKSDKVNEELYKFGDTYFTLGCLNSDVDLGYFRRLTSLDTAFYVFGSNVGSTYSYEKDSDAVISLTLGEGTWSDDTIKYNMGNLNLLYVDFVLRDDIWCVSSMKTGVVSKDTFTAQKLRNADKSESKFERDYISNAEVAFRELAFYFANSQFDYIDEVAEILHEDTADVIGYLVDVSSDEGATGTVFVWLDGLTARVEETQAGMDYITEHSMSVRSPGYQDNLGY